jgi:uncharacterized protein YbjT (DUF2867 family)
MYEQTAVVIGATGLVGTHLLGQLLNDDSFSHVRILVRKPISLNHPKLETVITDFNNYEAYQKNIGTGDCLFCCIGTTNANVKGDKMEYRKIDFDIPVNAARFGKKAGFQQFLIVTAATANSKSFNFYNRIKGEVEEVIATLGFQSFHIFRPSVLLGNRKEQRTGESIFKQIFKAISFLLPPAYKPIDANDVASAMIKAVKKGTPGMNIYYFKEMMQK